MVRTMTVVPVVWPLLTVVLEVTTCVLRVVSNVDVEVVVSTATLLEGGIDVGVSEAGVTDGAGAEVAALDGAALILARSSSRGEGCDD